MILNIYSRLVVPSQNERIFACSLFSSLLGERLLPARKKPHDDVNVVAYPARRVGSFALAIYVKRTTEQNAVS